MLFTIVIVLIVKKTLIADLVLNPIVQNRSRPKTGRDSWPKILHKESYYNDKQGLM